jgi:hypothetical protein
VNIVDQGDVGVVKFVAWDLVRVTVVIAAHLDDDEVGWLLSLVVELLGLVAEERVGTAAGVRGMVPVPGLLIAH